jgi:SpoVK/Ycf46/Vps4 family AAA+-type ATPase
MDKTNTNMGDELSRLQRLAEQRGKTGSTLVLFSGPSGTGKTMAAERLAAALGRPLARVDLDRAVSKHIGETEKNLAGILDRAEEQDAVLLFDEADALLGRRTGIKDAHDRYANIGSSYLLQRMEQYGGLVILASNQPETLDPAFRRRLLAVIEFPPPGDED